MEQEIRVSLVFLSFRSNAILSNAVIINCMEQEIMSLNLNKYRADLLPFISAEEQKAGKHYVVPCGMNTIIKLSDRPFSVHHLFLKHGHKEGKAIVVSKWNEHINDYVVAQVIACN